MHLFCYEKLLEVLLKAFLKEEIAFFGPKTPFLNEKLPFLAPTRGRSEKCEMVIEASGACPGHLVSMLCGWFALVRCLVCCGAL